MLSCQEYQGDGNLSKENELTKVPHQILEEAQKAGIESDEKNRSGTFFHLNQTTLQSKVNELFEGKLELMDIKVALKKYSWLHDYMWKIVDKNKDEFTESRRRLQRRLLSYVYFQAPRWPFLFNHA